jgi:hypothetical protein
MTHSQNPHCAKSLARMATRAEMRQPGTMERIFGGTGRGSSMEGMMGGMGGEERDSSPPMLSVLRITGEAHH